MAKSTKKVTTPTETPKPHAVRKTTTKNSTPTLPTADQIRARAFEIYLSRNGAPGDAAGDWAQAERQLTVESGL
jgi:hypothetical protein